MEEHYYTQKQPSRTIYADQALSVARRRGAVEYPDGRFVVLDFTGIRRPEGSASAFPLKRAPSRFDLVFDRIDAETGRRLDRFRARIDLDANGNAVYQNVEFPGMEIRRGEYLEVSIVPRGGDIEPGSEFILDMSYRADVQATGMRGGGR